jgi:hypothetical protein
MKPFLASLVIVVLCARAFAASEDQTHIRAAEATIRDVLQHTGAPPRGDGVAVIPTAEVAIAVHDAIASAAYGRDLIQKERPFHAVRVGEFWFVTGTMPEGALGGVASTVIRASNGEVLRLIHPQ